MATQNPRLDPLGRCSSCASGTQAQQPAPGVLAEKPASALPAALAADPETVGELLDRMKQLEAEVRAVRSERDQQVEDLRSRVKSLQNELNKVKDSSQSQGSGSSGSQGGSSSGSGSSSSGDSSSSSGDSGGGDNYSGGAGSGTLSTGGGGGSSVGGGGGGGGSIGRGSRTGERNPLGQKVNVEYKYNFAGGYFNFADDDKEFVLNIQNMIAMDGTFFDRQEAPTREKGFNIPFQRLYAYGNVTKNWEYQISEQASLGGFNLLDLLVNVHYDDRLMLKFGRFLTPFYYQDYATFPMLVPTMSYSPLSNFSGQRQVGAMIWGKPFDNRVQYQLGIFNGIPDGYYDFDTNKDFAGSLTITPFKPYDDSPLRDLGFGVSAETGWQNYMLNRQQQITFIAGAGTPTTNRQFFTSTGVSFFEYNSDVRADGNRTRIAPHIFYYNRFSLLAEYVIQSRELANPTRHGMSVQRGFYVQTSYFLTGEKNRGDGTGGFPTIIPNHPLNPSKGEYGPGAWELASMYTLLDVGTGDIARGFAAPTWATRLNEVQVGMNWWPNKYVRVSFDWVYDRFNQSIPWPVNNSATGQTSGPVNPINQFTVFWTRMAFFF